MMRTMRRSIGFVVAIGVLLTSVPGHAAVLCRKRAGVVVQRDACKKNETALDPAALGLVGPKGDPGDTGPVGPSAVIRKNFALTTLASSTYTTLGSLQLPAGKFLVQAHAWLNNRINGTDSADCAFDGLSGLTGSISLDMGAFNAGVHAVPVFTSTTATGPGTISWQCRNGQGDTGMVDVRSLSLTAIETASITQQ